MPKYNGVGVPYFDIAFAQSGIVAAVPDPAAIDGSMSYTQGFTTPYELPPDNPAYLPVPLNQTNQVFNDITVLLKYIGAGNFPPFITTAMNDGINPYTYGLGAGVSFDAGLGLTNWISTAANNTTTPGAMAATWLPITQTGSALYIGGTTTGSTNAQAVVTNQGDFANTAGNIVTFKAGFSVTGASTIDPDGSGTIPMKVMSQTGVRDTKTGDVVVGGEYMGISDGTNIQVLNPTRVGFAAWTYNGFTAGTVYQAATDGIITAYAVETSPGGLLTGFTDAANPPTNAVIESQISNSDGGTVGITFPVRKGDYWKITQSIGTLSTPIISFLQVGN